MRFSSPLTLGFVAASFQISHAAPVRQIVPTGAVSFTSKWQGFSIWMPGENTASYKVGTLSNGEKVPTYSVSGARGPVFYHLTVFTHPPSVDVSNPKARLDLDQKSRFSVPGQQSQKAEEIQLGQFLGRNLQWRDTKTGWVVHHRWFLTPKRYYQMSAYGPAADMQKQSAPIQRVFDSFRILPQ